MKTIEQRFYEMGVVPVVVLEQAEDAVLLARALMEGGLPCAEVTFRTEAAAESIGWMVKEYPDMLVGAGTVLTTKQVDQAMKAGAKFIVSPGFDPEIVDYCLEKEIPVFPGCITPSEVAQAVKRGQAMKAGAKFIVSPGFDPEIVDYCLEKEIPVFPGCITPSEVAQAVKRGLKVVKFFPAQQAGGLDMIKAMAAPYPMLKFMPTGGINLQNMEKYLSCGLDMIKAMAAPYPMLKFMPTGGINLQNMEKYLSCDKILCCGGSWMVKSDLIQKGDFDTIRELSAEARKKADSVRA